MTAGFCILLALLSLTPAFEGSQPIHMHSAATGAWFNGECPLAALAAFHRASPLPAAPPAIGVTYTSNVEAPAKCERPSASPVLHSDPRAPPTPLA